MELSIVVSTFNRARDLKSFIDSILAMNDPHGRGWELIVVDNNSTDDTRDVVLAAEAAFPLQIRYLFEPRQGKSFGLNTGLTATQGHILAFTDDDAIIPTNWAASIIDFFERNASAACVGGQVVLHNPDDAPTSIRTSATPGMTAWRQFSAENIPIIGCNMAFRASLIREIGAFDVDIGPGSKFGVAEDLDYLYRIVRAGHPIYYEPSISLRHNHGRRTASDLARLEFNYATGRGAFYAKFCAMGDRQALRLAWWELRKHLRLAMLFTPFSVASRLEFKFLATFIKGAFRYLALRKPQSLPNPMLERARSVHP